MTIEYLKAELEIKSDDGVFGVIEGYGSVYGNTDLGKDIVMPGAFKALDVSKVKMLWQHDARQPIGVWDSANDDTKGLFMKGRLALKTPKGAEAYELMKMGAMDGFSIGYQIKPGGSSYDAKSGARHLKDLLLHEVSAVTFPMNTLATATRVKSATNKRDLEHSLRDVGLSASEAKYIVGLTSLPAVETPAEDEAVTKLRHFLADLKTARQ